MPRVGRKRLSGSTVLAAGTFAAMLLAVPAFAEDKPAVSGINGKVDVTAGAVDSYNTTLYSGSISAPLGQSFGAQLDFTGGEFSADRVIGLGGHLFWRDPDIGLAGIVASRSGFADVWGSRYGAEAEAYFGPLTLALTGGWQNGERKVFIHTPWYGADARFYPLDDLMLEFGGSHYAKVNAGHVGAEWRPGFLDAVPGATLFADIAIGNKGYDHSLAGVRIYFGGGDKSLIRRHREDDPLNMLVGGVAGSGSSAAFGGSATKTTGSGCFVAGTLVLMADGSTRPIEDVAIGDVVRGADGASNRVEALHRPLLGDTPLYAINGGAAFVTDDHPFMTRDGWKAINPVTAEKTNPGLVVGALTAGDVLVTADGEETVAMVEAHPAAIGTPLFNFSVSGNRTFFVRPAGGGRFSSTTREGGAGAAGSDGAGGFRLVHNKGSGGGNGI